MARVLGSEAKGSRMIDDRSSTELQRLQGEILEAIARGEPLARVADHLCRRVEVLAADVLCSILTVDAQGNLHPLAAPSLPEHYSRSLDGVPIGPAAGSCGTAAWRGTAVEVSDIESDPLWADFRALALPLGLHACWSSPIKARDGHVVGTFAFYYRSRRGPAELERAIVERCVDLCAIAI
jgi:GAF domain-containing protein